MSEVLRKMKLGSQVERALQDFILSQWRVLLEEWLFCGDWTVKEQQKKQGDDGG